MIKVQPPQLRSEFRVRQIISFPIVVWCLWCASTGKKQARRFKATLLQPSRYFESDDRTHAVSKERERLVYKGKKVRHKRVDQRSTVRKGRLIDAASSSRILDHTNLQLRE